MPRIFNSIRQRLLKENRFTRYLVYAIGEILLVVVGILIALQINNWNEHRKHVLRQVDMIDAMILDLNEKMEENILDLAGAERMLVRCEKAMNDMASGGHVDTADVKQLIGYLGTDTYFYVTTTPTFNSIVNSDLWQQLPDTVAQAVQFIYDHKSTRVKLGFEKVIEYATDCRLNYLAPNLLMDPELDPMALSAKIAEDPQAFRARMILFMNAANRQIKAFAGSRDAIAEVIPMLISYRDDLADGLE
ncbi:MAG: hypothetical protein IPM46_14910 [Flavobacteriales bacterium]|nr:hypothetical protein [Flavobacteriales bacterium]